MPKYDKSGTRLDIPVRPYPREVRRLPFGPPNPGDSLFLTGPEGTFGQVDNPPIERLLRDAGGKFVSPNKKRKRR